MEKLLADDREPILWDYLVIGGGVVGSAIARELSRYMGRQGQGQGQGPGVSGGPFPLSFNPALKIGVLEKNPDVCCETSGRNTAVIHGGFAYDTGSLKARFCVEGNRGMTKLAEDLDFRFIRTGKVLIGNTDADMASLKRTMAQGERNGVEGLRLMDGEELHRRVPSVNGKFAMWSPNSGIVDPFMYTIALAENAAMNGVRYFLNTGVTAAAFDTAEKVYRVTTNRGVFRSRWVINSAGLSCGQVSDMLGLTGYRVVFSKDHYIILDQRCGADVPLPLYTVPSNTYMGIHVTPTVDGNVLVGPDAEEFPDLPLSGDGSGPLYDVPQRNIDFLAEDASILWPHIHKKDYIRTYCGILPKWTDENGVIQDFRIEIRDDIAPQAVNLVGIESPGLTCAVPIARHVVSMIREREPLEERPDFNGRRKGIRRFADMTDTERAEAIRRDPDYGELVCRCERVSRAEILQAIRNPLGVETMTGIKYRTRSMMGRCQGGYCQMRVEQMLEEEKHRSETEILYSRPGSQVLFGKVREAGGETARPCAPAGTGASCPSEVRQ
ncbi:MAG: NAD(P)/FAD-dependent oxidoreductase [Fretibacterium sp.]|nr:NAD(P)/FAD-dependent oxidoreductase [Fretibacterium sp.]